MKAVEIGRGADGEGRITEPSRTFDPASTVCASIATEGAGTTRLHIEWRARGNLLGSEVREVSPKGPAHFVFQFAPPEGWPVGRAQFFFFTDERDKHSAVFEVH